jgi:hypothetical protein
MDDFQVDTFINDCLKAKEPVVIHLNWDTGKKLYSVALVDPAEFWLASFKTKKEAVDYCKQCKLPVTNYIKDRKPY